MNKKRYLGYIIGVLCFSSNKMALISGPRQCGKTTMAKMLLSTRKKGAYYNWDDVNFRRIWTKNPSQLMIPPENHIKPLVILDEIHKAKFWKRQLKGVYDTLNTPCDILVTGSARLNIYRKGSDSLMGRYFHFRLHPLSLSELLGKRETLLPEMLIKILCQQKPRKKKSAVVALSNLMQFGPFPEPLLKGSRQHWNLWRRGRVEKIVREDLRDMSRLPELSQVEMLVSLLPERVANPLSIQSLSEDIEVAYTTIKRWLSYLKELYYYFELKPYTKMLPRSIKKMGKLYLWDWSEVQNEGARFENLIASHLLKYCHYLTDTGEGNYELRYIRNKQKKEIDFLVLQNAVPTLPIEVKLNDIELSKNWTVFIKNLPCSFGIQIVLKKDIYQLVDQGTFQVLIISADLFLRYLI